MEGRLWRKHLIRPELSSLMSTSAPETSQMRRIVLPPGPMIEADLFRIDHECFDTRCVRAQFLARCGWFRHDIEDLASQFAVAGNGLAGDVKRAGPGF
jgi:hypothetical protein